jgi:ATP-binding protein involved in chromosome partitioning
MQLEARPALEIRGAFLVAIAREQVLQALATVKDTRGATLPASGRLSDIVVDQSGRVTFSIAIDPPESATMERVRQAAEAAVKALPEVTGVFIALTADRPAGQSQGQGPATAPHPAPGRPATPPTARSQAIPGVKKVIAVASGKGGVGKSTTACNSACRRSASRSASSMPTSTAPPCRSFSASAASRRC